MDLKASDFSVCHVFIKKNNKKTQNKTKQNNNNNKKNHKKPPKQQEVFISVLEESFVYTNTVCENAYLQLTNREKWKN